MAERSAGGAEVIDLSSARWADPVLVAGVASVAQRAKTEGREVIFIPPSIPDTQGYIARMRLGKALNDLGVAHGLPTVNERNQEGNLLELRTFSTEHDGEQLAGLDYDRVSEMGQVDRQILEPLQNALMELAINTALHAGVEHGYALAQTYRQKGQIKSCVADAGVGLKASLDRNGQLHPNDDGHALELAVVRQISGADDSHRGYGLPDVVSTVRGLGGVTEIASGTASTRYLTEREGSDVTDVSYASPLGNPYSGVTVQITIPWVPGR